MHPVEKEATPLNAYYIDPLHPLEGREKIQRILPVIDAYTKFVWRQLTKTTDVCNFKIEKNQEGTTFIIHKGAAFTSKDFENYYTQENIPQILYYCRSAKD